MVDTEFSDHMKVTLDLDQLVKEGLISETQRQQLSQYGHQLTVSVSLNILLSLGILATTGGLLTWLHSSVAAIVIGLLIAIAGATIILKGDDAWHLLGHILLPLGALIGSGGIIGKTHGHFDGFLLSAVLLGFGGLITDSGLLASLSAFACLGALGGMTGYEHAGYYLCIEQPLWTILVFSALALATFYVATVHPKYHPKPLRAFSRTSVVIANFGFWVGSLWGDPKHFGKNSDLAFIIGWALLLLTIAAWAALRDHKWIVTICAVFGSIHFYTQWFERLHHSPKSLVAAGVIAIGIAAGLMVYHRRVRM
jgi:iron complex transport system permease protein